MKRNKLLSMILLMSALFMHLMPTYAEEPATVTIQGTTYYGKDYIQWNIEGSGDYYFDILYDGEIYNDLEGFKCQFESGVNAVGIDVPAGTDPEAFTLNVYSLNPRGFEKTVVITGTVQSVKGVLTDKEETIVLGLQTGKDGTYGTFEPDNAYTDENGNIYDLIPGSTYSYELRGDDTTSTVIAYVNNKGTLIKQQTVEVKEGAPVTVTLPESFVVDEVTYYPVVKSVTVEYGGSTTEYVLCRNTQHSDGTFRAVIELVSEATNKVLVTDHVYVDKKITYAAPVNFSISMDEGGMKEIKTYTLADGGVNTIVLEPGTTEKEVETFTIKYKETTEIGEVTWKITVVDGSGRFEPVIHEYNVRAGEPAKEVDPKTLVPNGYVLASTDETLRFEYGDSELNTTVYVVPSGYVPEEMYQLTVKYVNIANNAVLKTIALDVNPLAYTQVTSDTQFLLDGKTYVRLAGQDKVYEHNFYNATRTYTFYYRDINDKENEHTVVTRVVDLGTRYEGTEVIYIDGGTRIIGARNANTVDFTRYGLNGNRADGGTMNSTSTISGNPEGTYVTSITNEDTGRNEVVDENGNTLEEIRIEDEKTPLVGGDSNLSSDKIDLMAKFELGPKTYKVVTYGMGSIILVLILVIIKKLFEVL